MAALTATTPTRAGVVTAGAAVAASDTIGSGVLGTRGALLEILNGNAASDVMSISDATVTTSGAAATPVAPTVVNATSRIFKITPDMADASGNVTVTHTVTATVTYKLYPLG